MPTLPSLPTALLKAFHAARCGSDGLRAKFSKSSKDRQYDKSSEVKGKKRKKFSPPKNPFSGFRYKVLSIGDIARATGSHLENDQNLFARNPIKKTTNGSFVWAVKRPGNTGDIIYPTIVGLNREWLKV